MTTSCITIAGMCYVGMARKQNGGYNASISVQTLIFHLVVNSTRLKTVRSAPWRCPNPTVALRMLENVVKVTNLEVVKIEFRHLLASNQALLICVGGIKSLVHTVCACSKIIVIIHVNGTDVTQQQYR